MKRTILSAYKKQLVSLATLVGISVFIWHMGPTLIINNNMPLLRPEKRTCIIALLFLIWLLICVLLDTDSSKTDKTSQTRRPSPEILKTLHTLHGRFQGALHFLKKTIINKQGENISLAYLPWYLLIGSKNSGKTTLLANSNINFILAKQFRQENLTNIPPSDSCDWWVTRDSVIVDVPGSWLHPSTDLPWNDLVRLIKTSPCKDQLNGAAITFSLPELMRKKDNPQKNLPIQDLKKRIFDLREKFGPGLPFCLVITKCDLLPGFLDFFGECSSDELAQAWGITLPVLQENEKLLDVFNTRFNALIKRLNKQLIWRLHQERNPDARSYIKDFPLQVERLKEAINTILKALMLPDIRLHSIYLTSAIQKNIEKPTTYLHSVENGLTHQTLQLLQPPAMPARAYFVRQVLLQGLLSPVRRPETPDNVYHVWQRRAVYTASIGTIVAAALLLGHDFSRSVQQAWSLQNDLTRYQIYMQESDQAKNHLAKALPLLAALQQAANSSSHKLSLPENVFSFYSDKSRQTADRVYHQAVQTIVFTEIKNSLENYLKIENNKNPERTYTALKAWLMLGSTQNRDASFIAATLNQIVPAPLTKQALKELTSHIDAAFNSHSAPIALDENLVEEVRKELANLPAAELGMVILKNMGENNADSIVNLGIHSGSPPIFVSKEIADRVPDMFTMKNFQKIITDEINIAATEALKGNWVLGNIPATEKQPMLDSLISQLRNQYISNYIDIWESLLANIQPLMPKNLQQTDNMIMSLTSNTSPLLQLLQTIQYNTSLAPIISASPKIQALNNLLANVDNSQQNPLYPVFVNLHQLHAWLQPILTARDQDAAAFRIAMQRMQDPANDPLTGIRHLAAQNPEPIKSWLDKIASESWGFVLEGAGKYIENAWEINIIPIYTTQIANRYPFNQTANQEVDLPQFTRFLGHQGTLANFYINFLKPFVNDSEKEWQWRTIDNQKIPFSDETLTALQHAAQLQRAFFPNGDNKLFVEFTMLPVSIEPRMKSFTLNVNGQQMTYHKKGVGAPRTLTWPGSNTAHETTLNFTTPNNQLISAALKGDWAWFRLVSHATQTINARKEILLNFVVNGHSAKYLLYTQDRMNPFVPLNISGFELPDELMG